MNFFYDCNGSICSLRAATKAEAGERIRRIMRAARPGGTAPRITYLGVAHPVLVPSLIVAKPRTPAEFRAARDMIHELVGAP